ncbi:hypothetical protein ROHU_026091 [Labeo rohita]|uniref:Uncharacterized protein n=1 Tax=Labeo rohita TaxID=84645 RepID=A0A498MGW5_LABRO|nr:hypothetical protein ROHU_026091 [Labeo rohita]
MKSAARFLSDSPVADEGTVFIEKTSREQSSERSLSVGLALARGAFKYEAVSDIESRYFIGINPEKKIKTA